MPRKTAAQKARAAAIVAILKKPIDQGPLKDGQPTAKKVQLSRSMTSKPKDIANVDTTVQRTATSAIVDSTTTAKQNTLDLLVRTPGHPRSPPPAAPPSLPSNTIILPPEADDAKLRDKYDVLTIGILPNAKMQSKVTLTLQALTSTPSDGKKMLVALTASSKAANKCVGIAEIAKREWLKERKETEKAKLYQYSGCWTRLETHVPKPLPDQRSASASTSAAAVATTTEDAEMAEEDDAEAFDDAAASGRKQVRSAACLVIYLSVEPVQRLRERYGEQVQEGEKG